LLATSRAGCASSAYEYPGTSGNSNAKKTTLKNARRFEKKYMIRKL